MEHNKRHSHSQLGIGIFLLIVGVALLLENFDILSVGSVWRFWPIIIIAIGLGRLLDAQVAREYQKACWMLFIGGWLFISELHVFGLHYGNSWPILLIGVGIGMLWKSFYPEHIRVAKDHCNGN
jgi:predicted tellurium resistance membrane protein TerC